MNHIALSRNDFDTLDPIHIETGLGIVVAVCLILAVALVVLVVWLSKPTLTPRTTGNQHGLTLLRQTIEALYPPEFADAERNHTAREATVEQAGEWVANLVERWR